MRAIVCKEYGPPEGLLLEEVPEPTPGPGEVVLDVKACAVNFPDVLTLQDRYQVRQHPPFTPGSEVAGIVSVLGAGVDSVRIGDRVFLSAATGGLAEKAVVSAELCVPVPDAVDLVHASAFIYAYGTSYHALHDRAHLQPGETLLVLGASGGVGLAAVELGAAHGARVIAAASSEEKLVLCREHGAAMTINYDEEDLKQRVRELTDGEGADVVYDAVGGPYTEPALRATAWAGRFLVIGFAAGEIPRIPLNLPLLKGTSIVGVIWGRAAMRDRANHRAIVAELLRLWGAGKIHPHVSATYPLEEAATALRQIIDRKATGKVVVTIGG
ncbi:MAG: Alcohol dehydrogenase zinc-binding domain protein [Acidimicrobiales bacterium]|nr:Alcohol dehydrogenase zinc-binding domain protein [Acidimicrobiales bacterium]